MKSTKLMAAALMFAAVALVIGSKAFTVNVMAQKGGSEICDNGVDDDGDKLVDCADSDCSGSPACQKTTGCSPGFYKNHPEIWVGICCGNTGQRDCAGLTTALNCKGSDASCGRSAAAAYLDACTGCTE